MDKSKEFYSKKQLKNKNNIKCKECVKQLSIDDQNKLKTCFYLSIEEICDELLKSF